MDAALWSKVKEIAFEAMDRDPAERGAYLASAGDLELTMRWGLPGRRSILAIRIRFGVSPFCSTCSFRPAGGLVRSRSWSRTLRLSGLQNCCPERLLPGVRLPE